MPDELKEDSAMNAPPPQSAADLQFLKEAVERRRRTDVRPRGIYLTWGVLALIGFPLVDFKPEYAGLYWAIASPVGGILSWLLGRRYSQQRGEYDRERKRRIGLHWFGFYVIGALMALIGWKNQISPAAFGQLITFTTICAYYPAAVHLDMRLIWPCLTLVAGLLFMIFVNWYIWTVMGVVFFLSMVYIELFIQREHGKYTGQA